MQKKIYIFFVLLIALVQVSHAQESAGFSISPPSFEVSANPGDTIKNVVKVTNITTNPIALETLSKDFIAVGNEGAVELLDENSSFSLASWVSFEVDTITLQPKQTALIDYQIKVPDNAEPGGKFASLIFRTVPPKNTEVTGATLAQEIGALVLMRVAGDAKEYAKISEFKSDRSIYEYGPIEFTLIVKNEGSVHVRPKTNVTITNTLGKRVASISLGEKNVLPAAERKFNGLLEKKYMFGRYTATATAVYGTKNTILTDTYSFVVIPYKVVIPVAVGILLLIIAFAKGRKRLSKAIAVILKG